MTHRIEPAAAAAVALLASVAPASAQTKYYMRGVVMPLTEAAAATPPSTTAACSLGSGRILSSFGNGSYTSLGDVTVAFSGTDAQAGAMVRAHCESFKDTNACEGFVTGAGNTIRMRAFKASAAEYAANNGRTYPYAGACTPAK